MYLLIDERGRKYLVKGNSDFHTNYGLIRVEDLTDSNIGRTIESNTGRKFFMVKPTIIDYIEKAKRGPQAVMLKDCGLIVAYTGIKSGSRVVEAGTGSGLLSMFLANVVAPEKLISYEIRDDFAGIAEKNFRKAGISNVDIKMKSIYEGIDEKNLDLIVLDLPEPWKVIEHARNSLKIGGHLVSYSPSIEQSKKFFDKLQGFIAETRECLMREWDMVKVRPYSRMVAHTGFITFARLVETRNFT